MISRQDGSKPKFIPIDIIVNIESEDGFKFNIIVDEPEYQKINKSKKFLSFNFGKGKKNKDGDVKELCFQTESLK